ncbi:T-complex 1 subunit delta, partial [Gregarina niphandrodes]
MSFASVAKGVTKTDRLDRNDRAMSTRQQNTNAAKAVADAVRTSLGPLGMDKLIHGAKGDVVITNDGATILKEMNVIHPAAKMLVELSESQDVEAGDGTTSVVVVAGALITAASGLLEKGLHPQTIAQAFLQASKMAQEVLSEMSIPVDVTDREELEKAVSTSLQSKVVSSLASHLAPIAVEAVCAVHRNLEDANVDLNDVRVVKQLGGTIDDSELVQGLVLPNQRVSRIAGGPTSCRDAKIGLIQFCLSLPKTDMDQQITIKDYTAMDRLLRQERLQMAKMVKKIQATGCNVLLVQKSILREAVNELALDFLAKANILVLRDIERDEVDFIARTVGCEPISSLEHFTPERLGAAQLVEEQVVGESRVVKFTGCKSDHTVSVILRASNRLTLEEAERSFRDAICVVRSMIRTRRLLPGGGAAETEMSIKLAE